LYTNIRKATKITRNVYFLLVKHDRLDVPIYLCFLLIVTKMRVKKNKLQIYKDERNGRGDSNRHIISTTSW
jgi:hypothetical protein